MPSTSHDEDADEEVHRSIFDRGDSLTQNSETGAVDIILHDELFTKGCGCQRKCVEKFSKDKLLMSHFSALELDYYCANHINHLNLYLQGKYKERVL